MSWCPPPQRPPSRCGPWPVALAAALVLVTLWPASIPAQSGRWKEANDLMAAIGGWRTYLQERHAPPAGYPVPPAEEAALTPEALSAAADSAETAAALAAWERRRFEQRSAPLAPPTLTYARTSAETETSQEVGVHLPLGAWLGMTRSIAADGSSWGQAERQALALDAARRRLALYAQAVAARAELAQAMDRREVHAVLEELTRRQREIGAVPEAELLSLRIDRAAAQSAVEAAREASLQAAERLALELGLSLDEATALETRLPLEPGAVPPLPQLDSTERLDLRAAEEMLSQQETTLARAETSHWMGGLELGLLQERSSAGEVANTVELSWRLPFGGESRRQTGVMERAVSAQRLALTALQRAARREQATAERARARAEAQLEATTAAVGDAELWMEEQVYRYSGMLIGPHDLLRAAARLRQVRSAHIAAQRMAFAATVDARFVRAIPLDIPVPQAAAPSPAAADAGH